jgi:hypothetical protein
MAWDVRGRKTEHAGAKHGCGAYYGPKAVAKRASSSERRRASRRTIAAAVEEACEPNNLPNLDAAFGRRRGVVRRDTRRWCGGKVGRPHELVLRETLGVHLGLPPLHVWACSRCGRKVYNLKSAASRNRQ